MDYVRSMIILPTQRLGAIARGKNLSEGAISSSGCYGSSGLCCIDFFLTRFTSYWSNRDCNGCCITAIRLFLTAYDGRCAYAGAITARIYRDRQMSSRRRHSFNDYCLGLT